MDRDAPVPGVSDPTPPSPTVDVAPPVGPRGRTSRSVALAVLVALAAAGVAVQQRAVADAWRDRATVVAEQRDEAIGRAEALGDQLEEVLLAQERSEAELAALTERVAALAGEKAEAEDAAVLSGAERDAVRAVAERVAIAVTGLDRCIVALLSVRAETVDAFNRLAAGESVDVAPLNASSTATIERCDAARRAAAAAGASAAALG